MITLTYLLITVYDLWQTKKKQDRLCKIVVNRRHYQQAVHFRLYKYKMKIPCRMQLGHTQREAGSKPRKTKDNNKSKITIAAGIVQKTRKLLYSFKIKA